MSGFPKHTRRKLKPAFPYYSREHSCEGKIGYTSEEAAQEKLIELWRDPKRRFQKAYRCLWCPAFHIGHPKEGFGRRR